MNGKKEVLLVMPNVPCGHKEWPVPPIGIPYISAYMKKAGISVHCLNLCICENPMDVLKETIQEKNIDIIATGDLVVNYKEVKEIIDCAKSVSSNVITMIGGGLVTHSPEEAMRLIPNADYGVIGEGEVTDCELVLALQNGHDPAQVPGIIYRKGTVLCQTVPRPAIDDLDALPWPDYEGFDYFETAKRYSGDGIIAAPLTTSRSCPFHCTFCSTSGGEKKYRQRSLDSVFEELQFLVDRYHVQEIFLNDELFAVNEDRLHKFCQRISPFRLKWYVFLRIGKHIRLELLNEMREAGCVTVLYGLESAHDGILKSMKKGISQKEMLRVLEITKKAGLGVRGNFIFGDTQETLETAEYTMEWVEQHADLMESVSFAPITLYPGSELYDRAVKLGKISDKVKFIENQCPLVNSSEQMSDQEYWLLVNEKIPSFAARYHRKITIHNRERLGENIIPDIQNGQYLHELYCEQCGAKIIERLHPISMFQHHVSCPNCGKQYDLWPGLVMLQQYEKNFFEQLQKVGGVIWGLGENAQDVYYNNCYFRESQEFILIDGRESKQKTGFHGKAVKSPKFLSTIDADCVVCFTSDVNLFDIRKNLEDFGIKAIGLYELLLKK